MVLIKCIAGEGVCSKRLFVFVCCLFMASVCNADLASTSYVQSNTKDKVSAAPEASQTMAGSYTVSGVLIVPTPPLPSAQ